MKVFLWFFDKLNESWLWMIAFLAVIIFVAIFASFGFSGLAFKVFANSADNLSQAVNETVETVAASEVGASNKIRVQKPGKHVIDWGDPSNGRNPFIINGLKVFGKNSAVVLGFRDDGVAVWAYVKERNDDEKAEEDTE